MSLAIDLTGRTILVSGCHKGGIGGATARQVTLAGGVLVLLDKDEETLAATAAEVHAMGGTAHTLMTDLTDLAQCEQVIARALDLAGAIHGIANIAGGTLAEEWLPLETTPADSFRRTMMLNYEYAFYLCRDVARHWIAEGQRGSIVNIGSVSAKDAAPWHGPYGAAKSAIITLTRTMANEWQELGIRANSVSPGAVMSERVIAKSAAMSQSAKDSRDPADKLILSDPVELANAITFLLSDLASGINGQNLTVDRALSTKFCAGGRRTRKEIAELQQAYQ
jgi:NAD(P)-dependent dehydrogenase (short-subunit alcohol dehydrogenase family)